MGAAAFIVADFLGVPYSALVLMALVPALLAYATLFILVDLEAVKLGLKGLPRAELPRFWPTLRAGLHYVFPLAYLLYALLIIELSPERAALNTIFLRVLPHSSTPAILSKTRLRMRLWTKRIRFTRAARPQKDQASMR